MNRWSDSSRAKLNTCHSDLILIFNTVLQIHDCTIVTGHRGQEEQHQAYLSGASQLDWPDGKHNALPSMAVDVQPYIRGLKINGANPAHLKYFRRLAGVVEGVAGVLYQERQIMHKIRWGGDWDSDHDMDDQAFNDLYHYELVGLRRAPVSTRDG